MEKIVFSQFIPLPITINLLLEIGRKTKAESGLKGPVVGMPK